VCVIFIKKFLSKVNDWFTKLPVSAGFFIFILFFFTLFSSRYAQDLDKQPCDFLACNYKTDVHNVLNFSEYFLYLPLLLPTILNNLSTGILLLSLILTFLYWVIIYVILRNIFYFFKKIFTTGSIGRLREHQRKERQKIGTEKLLKNAADMIFFLIFLIYGVSFVNTVFYYPKVAINITFTNYVEISSFIIIALTLFWGVQDRLERSDLKKTINSFILFTMFFVIMGLLLSFTYEISIQPRTQENDAYSKAAQISSLAAGLWGLLSSIFIFLTPPETNIKTKKCLRLR